MTTLYTFPDTHETDYTVHASRLDGERALGYIAASSIREYLWTFAESSETWKNHAVEHFEHRTYRRGVLWAHRLGGTIPEKQRVPDTKSVSMYHNHPSAPDSFEHPEIKVQLPSSEDIETCVRLSLNGYKDFRIATALGITTLTLDSAAAAVETITIKGFCLKARQMRSWERKLGTIKAIQEAANFFTEKLDGQVHVNFNPFLE